MHRTHNLCKSRTRDTSSAYMPTLALPALRTLFPLPFSLHLPVAEVFDFVFTGLVGVFASHAGSCPAAHTASRMRPLPPHTSLIRSFRLTRSFR